MLAFIISCMVNNTGGHIWHPKVLLSAHSEALSLSCQFLTVAALTTCYSVLIFQSFTWTTSAAPSLPYIDQNKGLHSAGVALGSTVPQLPPTASLNYYS